MIRIEFIVLRNILDGVEALSALERWGTASEAAIRLRLSQSAVSKRLTTLSREVGFAVTEPRGRRLEITPAGLELIERARPLLASLRELALKPVSASPSSFSLALAESIAASWGPWVVADALAGLPEVRVELHAHRSVLLLEAVRLGRYHVGLSTPAASPPDLLQIPLYDEPMVHVRSGHRDRLITIEPSSATWRAIEPALRHHPELSQRERVPVESFSAALQMVRAGFGDGLVPLGLVLQSELPLDSYTVLPTLTRPISLQVRKTVHHLARFASLRDALVEATSRWFSQRYPLDQRSRPR
jgi:DNA-binding transcriptional LysR family regulator